MHVIWLIESPFVTLKHVLFCRYVEVPLTLLLGT